MKTKPNQSAMQKRALDAAETALEASGLRYMSSQIPGLAHLFVVFAEHEIRRHRDPSPSAHSVQVAPSQAETSEAG